ncbi:hypothetical protein QOZ80_3BG0266990 [Eleusine coracana subsp. coracana]|nr:hypothetical protein QOZ80_3BG0266990 [Eleusine coracana subsp. coracana]
MALSGFTTLQSLTTMAPQHIWSGDATVNPPPIQDPAAAAASPEMDTDATAAEDNSVDDRWLRRRISNRESARRCRARKQRRLQELRASVARLEVVRRELAARAQAARGRVAMVRLANAGLRAEANALTRRLEAARRTIALRHLYVATIAAAGSGSSCCGLGPLDIEQTIASLIA